MCHSESRTEDESTSDAWSLCGITLTVYSMQFWRFSIPGIMWRSTTTSSPKAEGAGATISPVLSSPTTLMWYWFTQVSTCFHERTAEPLFPREDTLTSRSFSSAEFSSSGAVVTFLAKTSVLPASSLSQIETLYRLQKSTLHSTVMEESPSSGVSSFKRTLPSTSHNRTEGAKPPPCHHETRILFKSSTSTLKSEIPGATGVVVSASSSSTVVVISQRVVPLAVDHSGKISFSL